MTLGMCYSVSDSQTYSLQLIRLNLPDCCQTVHDLQHVLILGAASLNRVNAADQPQSPGHDVDPCDTSNCAAVVFVHKATCDVLVHVPSTAVLRTSTLCHHPDAIACRLHCFWMSNALLQVHPAIVGAMHQLL